MNEVILNTTIIVGCYAFMTIALTVATLWVYKLKAELRELKRTSKLAFPASEEEDTCELCDEEHAHDG